MSNRSDRFEYSFNYFYYIKNLALLVALLGNPAWANFSEFHKGKEFKSSLAFAIAGNSSSFEFESPDGTQTSVLGMDVNYELFRSHQNAENQAKLLLSPKTHFQILGRELTSLGSKTHIRVKLPQETTPSFFDFYWTPIQTQIDESDLDADGPPLNTTTRNRLRLAVNALARSYTGAPEPITLIGWIKNRITPESYNSFPTVMYLRALQDARAIPPALTLSAEMQVIHNSHQADLASEEYQNCTELGGTLEVYTLEENEAYLCRFGEGGIGASALLHYRHDHAVASIDAFLQSVPFESPDTEGFAVVPAHPHAADPTHSAQDLGRFLIQGHTDPAHQQAGIRLMMHPKVKASFYCRQRGGKPTQLTNPSDGTHLKACIFTDFSGIDAYTLFKGPSDPSNTQLVDVLKSLRTHHE
jgi:putative hemolysin